VLVRVDTRGRLQWSRVLSSRSPTAAVIAGPVVVSPRGRIAVGVGFEVGLVAEPSAAVSPNGSSRTDLAVVSYDTQGRVRGRLVDGGADHEWVEGLHVRPDGGLTALLTFPTSGSVGTDGPSEQRFLGLGGPAQAILVDYSVGSFRP
jgi:hypothetical protein